MAIRTVTIAGVGLADRPQEEPLAGAPRPDPERDRTPPRAVHVGPHVLRVLHPDQQRRDVDDHEVRSRATSSSAEPSPVIVSFVVAVVIALIVVHAFLAVRKFPINYRQFRFFRGHMKMMRHEDTTLWWLAGR